MAAAVRRFLVRWPEEICGREIAFVTRGYLHVGEHMTVGVERRRALDAQGQPYGETLDRLIVDAPPTPMRLEVSLAAAVEMFRAAKAKTFVTEHQPITVSMPWLLLVYHLHNEGLVIAEWHVEPGERMTELPDWCGADITDDPRFDDARLALQPYQLPEESTEASVLAVGHDATTPSQPKTSTPTKPE
jgi:CYTH domain-containing protein